MPAPGLVSFQDLTFILRPADPDLRVSIVEADDRWRPRPRWEAAHDVVLWGHEPLRAGTPLPRATRWAVARERALRAGYTRPKGAVRIHRLGSPRLAGGRVRSRARTALLGGAIVEMWGTSAGRRILDAVARHAPTAGPVSGFALGSGGSALVRGRTADGQPALVRVARRGSPGDPLHGAEALAELAPLGLSEVPILLGRGTAEGASWEAESLLPGHRPARLTERAMREIGAMFSRLPRSEEPAAAHQEDLRSVAGWFPEWAGVIDHVGDELRDVARAVASVPRHGDLWQGNILVRRGRLTGVIDWDAWHPAALPGLDLLHLVGVAEELRTREGLGSTWLRRPWLSERFRSLTADYWTDMRMVSNERYLDALGLAWWACYVGATLRRLPELRNDARWRQENVERVMNAVAGRA